VYVEFGTNGHVQDDAGEAYYNIAGSSDKFTVMARKPSSDVLTQDHKLTISLDGMSTNQSPKSSKVDLGFKHDGAVNWIMSIDQAGKWWSNSGPVGAYSDWMQQSMGSLANRTLRHICMPGSHDAGMGPDFEPGTFGSHFANTQTQYLDIAGQLMAGSRYFDLRPVISNGQWVSGHYSRLGDSDLWVGGNGQSIASIIQQINDFTSKHQELIILNLSHTLDTDNQFLDLTQAQWNSLFDTLKQLNNRFITATNPGTTDFSTRKLSTFITDRASVFTIAQLPSGISLGPYATQGFYTSQNFPVYDSYSNTNSRTTLKSDQLAKLASNRNLSASKSTFHVLSWTLTQQPDDVFNFDRAILNLAAGALDDLVSEAWNAFTPDSFPNVLFVDALGVREKSVVAPWVEPKRGVGVVSDVAALAMGVNNWVVKS